MDVSFDPLSIKAALNQSPFSPALRHKPRLDGFLDWSSRALPYGKLGNGFPGLKLYFVVHAQALKSTSKQFFMTAR